MLAAVLTKELQISRDVWKEIISNDGYEYSYRKCIRVGSRIRCKAAGRGSPTATHSSSNQHDNRSQATIPLSELVKAIEWQGNEQCTASQYLSDKFRSFLSLPQLARLLTGRSGG